MKKNTAAIWAAFAAAFAVAAGAENTASPVDRDGTTPLLWAVYNGNAGEVADLLEAGAAADAGNVFGATPVGEAARLGHTDILRMLLEAGADPESANHEGQTALMAVARTGNVEAAKLLVKHGARVDARERWGGQTALIWAAAQDQPEMIRFLCSKGADVDASAAVREWARRVTAEGRPKDMNRGGLTGLLYAAREGHLPAIGALVECRADLDKSDPDGTTPLIVALMNGHWDAAKLLVESGADVNLWDWWGQSPLYMAVDMNTLPTGSRVELPGLDRATGIEVINLLLAKGANPNVQLKLRPPFRNVPQDRLSDPMITTGATPLLRAAKGADLAAIETLLAAGAIVDLPNMFGHTPLMAAAGAGRGNNPTRGGARTEDAQVAAVKILHAAGADVNTRTVAGETAIHGAAIRGANQLVELLAGYGAQLDAADKDGMTPIDYALARYPLNYLESKPVPYPETAALLKTLGATRETPEPPKWPDVGVPLITAEVPE